MASPYEYGLIADQERGLLGTLANMFSPVRRPVRTPSETTYMKADGALYPQYKSATYGEPEFGFQYMPAYRAISGLLSSPEVAVDAAAAMPEAMRQMANQQVVSALDVAGGGSGELVDEAGNQFGYDALAVSAPLAPAGIAAAKAGGTTLGAMGGRVKPLTKTQLDPMKYSGIKLDEPLSEMQYDFEPMSLLFPDRKIVKPESLLGKVALFGAGDRSGVGTLKSLSGQVFDEPVSALGGRDYQLATPYAWASDEGVISGLLARAKKAQEETGIEDVVLAHSTMNPRAVDFTDFNSAAVAEMLKTSKITKKDAKQFDDEIKKSFPSFPGVKSPKFREWMKSQKSGKTRATIIKEMDKDLWRSKGFPMVGKARYALTEKAQQDVPTFQTGLSFIPIDVASGAVKSPIMPHSTYNTAMRRAGDPVQLSGTIPNETFYRDFFKTLEGATTKSGAPQPASMKQYTTRLNNPYQIVDQELVDTMSGLLGY